MIHFRPVFKVVGVMLLVIGLLMFTGIIFSITHESGDGWYLLWSGLITIGFGGILFFVGRGSTEQVNKREGYLIVALGWVSMVFFGMSPYLISGVIPNITNAVFETVSGMTTTGASILNDIEVVPEGILYWRSLTQWIGGMGIIVLTVALFPLLGIGGIELFVAEAPGPTSDKLHPRIQETAKRLWFIYVGLTVLLGIILKVAGMTTYDAVNHALTTMATGGFSTKNASMMYYDIPAIQYPIIIFMFIAGTNYSVIYFSLRGRFKEVLKSDEFKTYLGLIVALSVILMFVVHNVTDLSFEKSFRDSAFQVISIITTTGFVSADYTSWTSWVTMLFFVMLFLGACSGSTSGGIKIIRHLVFFKNSVLEFKRLLHPNAIVPLRLSGETVRPRILTHILVFLLLYLMLFVIGSMLVTMMGMDFLSAIGAVATSLGNVGPAIGSVGPVNNFADVPMAAKWLLCFLMLLGRLELFTILVLFTPYFWRAN
ncbi:MAG: potassium transporter TrkG [Bacteroidota bacterium]